MNLHDVTRINVRSFVRNLHTIHTYFLVERCNKSYHISLSIRTFFQHFKWCSRDLYCVSDRASWRLGARPNQNIIWEPLSYWNTRGFSSFVTKNIAIYLFDWGCEAGNQLPAIPQLILRGSICRYPQKSQWYFPFTLTVVTDRTDPLT